ncbi:hypothetical protein D3C86_1933950 [compost metagenome]
MVINVEELPFLLFRFHPVLHLLDRMRQITASAPDVILRLISFLSSFGVAVLLQRLFESSKPRRNVRSATRKSKVMKSARFLFIHGLLNEFVQHISVDRSQSILLVARNIDLPHTFFLHFGK